MNDEGVLAEAHWYSSGLRHCLFGSSDERPSWVAPPGWVGLRDGETLQPGEYAVEYQRIASGDHNLQWLAVYRHYSADQKFGDRAIHTGIGLWIRARPITHGTLMVNALRQLTDVIVDKIALGQGPEPAKAEVDKFIKSYVGAYLGSEQALGSVSLGLKAGGAVGRTKTFGATGDGAWHDAGERIETLAFMELDEASRVVIRIGPNVSQLEAARPEDVTAYVLKLVPQMIKSAEESASRLHSENINLTEQLDRERDELRQARQQSDQSQADYQAELDRVKLLEEKLLYVEQGFPLPLQNAINGINNRLGQFDNSLGDKATVNEIFRKLDSIQSAIGKLEKSQSLLSAPTVFQGKSLVPTCDPAQRLPALPPEQDNRWSSVGKVILAVTIVVVTVIVVALALKFWSNSPAAPVKPPPQVSAYSYSLSTPEQLRAELQKSRDLVNSYSKLAETGDALAQQKLGLAYFSGRGVAQDYVEAYKWFILVRDGAADAKTRDIATKNMDMVTAKMQPAQIAEAERLASEWRNK